MLREWENWEQRERHKQGLSQSSETGNAKEGDTETASQVLKGRGKKTHSCSSFPFLLIDTGEMGAQEDGKEQKGVKLERGLRKEIKNGSQKKGEGNQVSFHEYICTD